MANPFLTGEDKMFVDKDEEGSDADQARAEMEEGGFTVVTQDDHNSSKNRGRDNFDNVVTGITEEEANKIAQKLMLNKR